MLTKQPAPLGRHLAQIEHLHRRALGIFIEEVLLERIPAGSAQHEQGLVCPCRQLRQPLLVGARRIRFSACLHRVPQLEHQPRLQLQRSVLPRLIRLLHGGVERFRIAR